MPGRKPHPTRLKELRGNPGKRPLNKREPIPPPFADGGIPRILDGDTLAIQEWQRLAPMLAAAKQITEADRSALIALCLEWSRYLKARRNAARANFKGEDGKGHSVWFSVQRHALTACMKLWPELGLTPSGRSRVHLAETPVAGGDTFSEFDNPPAEDTEDTEDTEAEDDPVTH